MAAAGLLCGAASQAGTARCPSAPAGRVVLTGHLEAATGSGPVPFVREEAPGCPPERIWSADTLPAGVRLRLEGVGRPGWGRGLVVVGAHAVLLEEEASPRWRAVRWREELRGRLVRLYGPRAPLVSALLLARREGLDPGLRHGFARTGIAHLLAISGFHVGVVAGLLYALLRAARLPRGRAGVVAAAASWGYVLLLGVPDAAARAALILTLAAVARLRARPAARGTPLAAALLVLLALDPGRVASVGFQLSFLGAAGLVAGRGPLEARLRRLARGRAPGWLVEGTAAGAAATAATLPVVAWHFEEVSVVGIPATLAASPLVSLALPGALASLFLEPFFPGAAAFLAGGVDLLLAALVHGTGWAAALPWAALWVPREWTAAACVGAGAGLVGARLLGLRAPSRRRTAALTATTLLVGWPLLVAAAGRGSLELRVLDVGQGDAIALRTPRGRWILVDAGPPWEGRGPGPVVGPLRRLGVTRLEALVLTHPDADHMGGAAAVLEALEVGAVLDPALPTGKEGYVRLLEGARGLGIPWRRAVAPLSWRVDGVELSVLHPDPRLSRGGLGTRSTVSNDVSVVLLVRWGAFEALLTGDASASVERALLPVLPDGGVEILKVGHHGSDTSTDSLLLARIRPETAVVSVGRGNRYGHPSPRVLRRLEAAGVPLHRTDREGVVRIQARPDGRFRVVAGGGTGGG